MQSAESIVRGNYEATIDALKQKLNLTTKLLSALCEHIEKTSQLQILATIEDGKLARWWGKHKKIEAELKAEKKESEARRIDLEHEKQKKKDIRDEVLKKLTPEEKKILGVS